MPRSPLLLLVAMGGCDLAFELSEVETVKAACGPYSSVTPVSIDARITEARNFSISADNSLALVFGRLDGGPARPIPLQDEGGTWGPHPQLQAGLSSIIDAAGANLAPAELTPIGDDYTMLPRQPVMMVWSGLPHQLARYYFTGTTWTFDLNMTPISDGEYDVRAGNVVVVTGAGGVDDIVRHTVQVKRAIDPTLTGNQILLSANLPPRFDLVTRPDRTRPLNERGLETGQAVLTENQRTLVYDANRGTDADVFASVRSDANDFDTGAQLVGVNTSDDEVEPWIDATCSTLYFRRRSAGEPNDPGQIFVAE